MNKQTHSEKVKIIGNSLTNLIAIVSEFARSGHNLLFVGERGTGKDLFAQLYTEQSEKESMLAINCAGISDGFLGSKLFGHIKGAFTGAIKKREGVFLQSDKKVIFLDEIGDASDNFQATLLRVLQSEEIEILGTNTTTNIKNLKPNVIAATSKIENLRDDLIDRFNCIYIPDLHDRKEDIDDLVRNFLANSALKEISEKAIDYLRNYMWLGNVRELLKVINEAEILCKLRSGETLRTQDMPSIYLEDMLDESDSILIKSLKSNNTPLPGKLFSREPKSHIDPRIPWKKKLNIEDKTKLYYEDPVQFQYEMLQNMRTKEIVGAIKKISNAKSKKPKDTRTEKLNFQSISPQKYEKQFWEYHISKKTRPADIAKQFNIPSSTASKKLKDFKSPS